jgi:hypothetical protein
MYLIKDFKNKKELHFLIAAFIFISLFLIFKEKFWNLMIVPNAKNDFADFRCVASWSRLSENISSSQLIYNDSSGCKINYPRIWIIISKFLNLNNETYLYTYVSILLILYIFIFYKLIQKYSSYFFIYIFFSGSSMLLLERGNIDIVIFILLYFLLESKNLVFRHFLFLLSVILKIFPIFGFLSLFYNNKNNYYFFITIFLCALYFFIFKNDFYMIANNTPKTGDMSYGTLSITKNLEKHFNIYFNYYYLSFFLVIFSLTIFFFFKKKIPKINNNRENNFYFMGGGIFIFSFLINSNFDYRLIFLTFSIPTILKIKNSYFKFLTISSLVFSLELHRLIYLIGFFGGVLNTISKIMLFILVISLYLNLIIINNKKNKLY